MPPFYIMKRQYLPPQLVVVSFAAERGFAFSSPIPDPEQVEMQLMMLGMMENEEYRQTETFDVYWGDSQDNGFFN